MNSVTLCCFAEGRIRLFGAEIFNGLSANCFTRTRVETAHIYNVQATVSGNACLSVLAQKSPLSAFMMGAVPSFQVHSCALDSKHSNGAKLAAIYMVFTICFWE